MSCANSAPPLSDDISPEHEARRVRHVPERLSDDMDSTLRSRLIFGDEAIRQQLNVVGGIGLPLLPSR